MTPTYEQALAAYDAALTRAENAYREAVNVTRPAERKD